MDFSEYTWVRWEGIQPSTYTSLKTTQIVSKIPSNLGEDWENCEIYTCYAVQCLVTQSWPVLCDPKDCSQPGSSVHEDSPGKNTGVGSHALLMCICMCVCVYIYVYILLEYSWFTMLYYLQVSSKVNIHSFFQIFFSYIGHWIYIPVLVGRY